jgi:hypothetical protein
MMTTPKPPLVYGCNNDTIVDDDELLILPAGVIADLRIFYEIITTARTYGEYSERGQAAIHQNPRLEGWFWLVDPDDFEDSDDVPDPSDPFNWDLIDHDPWMRWPATLAWVMVGAMTLAALDALDHLCGGPPLSMGSGSDTMNIPWSKKGDAVAALEAAGFEVVEDQEAFDRLLAFDPTVP